MDIAFYHLTVSPLSKALPKLLEKVLASGARALVQCTDNAQVDVLNDNLWTYTTKFFLPHGTEKDGFVDEQPIYLAADEKSPPNGAQILALVGMSWRSDVDKFQRCLYLFDGANTLETEEARRRWKIWREEKHNLSYWQQDAKGAWIKKEQ